MEISESDKMVELKRLMIIQAVNIFLYTVLLGMICYMIYALVIKHKYFRDENTLIFYICAFLICIFRITNYILGVTSWAQHHGEKDLEEDHLF